MAAWEFQRLQNIAERNGWHKFISMQNLVHLLYREEEREMIPYCNAAGVGLIPWSPLARGSLARPWRSHTTKRSETDEYGLPDGPNEDADKTIVNRVEELAKKRGVPMSAIATAWVLQKGACPIVGLSTRERVDQTLLALSIYLSCDEVKYLEEPYKPRYVTGY
jgi:aryl-alcohol dehydrogenase-like predicted oxidoreductase